jgi:hypothetical protein
MSFIICEKVRFNLGKNYEKRRKFNPYSFELPSPKGVGFLSHLGVKQFFN